MRTQKALGTLVTVSVLIAGCSATTAPTDTPTSMSTTPAMSTTLPMSYQTYTDASLPFTFEYPTGWKVQKDVTTRLFSIINPADEAKCAQMRNDPMAGSDNAFECAPLVEMRLGSTPKEILAGHSNIDAIKNINDLTNHLLGEKQGEDILFLGKPAKAGNLINNLGGGIAILQQNNKEIIQVVFHNRNTAWKESLKDFNEIEKHILNSFKAKS